MHVEHSRQIKIVSIRIEPYLAEYARSVFDVDRQTGAVRIPYTSELYHCVWEHMAKRRVDQPQVTDGNLCIILPSRRVVDEGVVKNPAYYNYLSPTAAMLIERHLRLRFNYEFHQTMLENEKQGRPSHQYQVAHKFMRQHNLESISEEALLKNFQRYRNRLYPKKARKYKKTPKFDVI